AHPSTGSVRDEVSGVIDAGSERVSRVPCRSTGEVVPEEIPAEVDQAGNVATAPGCRRWGWAAHLILTVIVFLIPLLHGRAVPADGLPDFVPRCTSGKHEFNAGNMALRAQTKAK